MEEGERWRRILNITVPSDIVQAERRAEVQQLSARVRLPGFRTGKVPAAVIEKRFGPTVDRGLLDRIIGDAYRQVLADRNLRPISEGEISDVSYAPDSDLTFQVAFDVAPTVAVARTGGFKVERPRFDVGGEEVERVLARVRSQQGTWRPEEGGSPADGDMVSVRIQRLSDGMDVEEDDEPRPYEFVLGEDQAIPEVEAAIRTLDVGEAGEFSVTFPDDFVDEERRGVAERLRIALDGRKVLELPELDDTFAQSVGDFESLDALRARIREDLEQEARREADAAVRGQLVEQLLAANPFDVPASMVDQYIRSVVGEERGLSEEEMSEARKQLGAQAEYAVKRFLVLEEIAREKGLAATEEDIDARVEELAAKAEAEPADVYARLQKSGRLERIEREVTDQKIFDVLISESTVTDAS